MEVIQLDRSRIPEGDITRIMARGYALIEEGRAADVECGKTDEGHPTVCVLGPDGTCLYHVARNRQGAFYALDGYGTPIAESKALEVVLDAMRG